MTDLSKTLEIASSGMKAQAARMRQVSENLANTDTPGYRRKISSFEQTMQAGTATGAVEMGRTRLDATQLPQVYDPAHPLADDAGYYQGSNVDLMIEIADAREAQRSYEANLKMFEQARKMSGSLLDLLRR